MTADTEAGRVCAALAEWSREGSVVRALDTLATPTPATPRRIEGVLDDETFNRHLAAALAASAPEAP